MLARWTGGEQEESGRSGRSLPSRLCIASCIHLLHLLAVLSCDLEVLAAEGERQRRQAELNRRDRDRESRLGLGQCVHILTSTRQRRGGSCMREQACWCPCYSMSD